MAQVYFVCILLAVLGVQVISGQISCYDCSYRTVDNVVQTDSTNNAEYSAECGFPSGVNTSVVPTMTCYGSCFKIEGSGGSTYCARRGCHNTTASCVQGASYTWNCGSQSITGTTHCCTGTSCNTAAGIRAIGLWATALVILSLVFKL